MAWQEGNTGTWDFFFFFLKLGTWDLRCRCMVKPNNNLFPNFIPGVPSRRWIGRYLRQGSRSDGCCLRAVSSFACRPENGIRLPPVCSLLSAPPLSPVACFYSRPNPKSHASSQSQPNYDTPAAPPEIRRGSSGQWQLGRWPPPTPTPTPTPPPRLPPTGATTSTSSSTARSTTSPASISPPLLPPKGTNPSGVSSSEPESAPR